MSMTEQKFSALDSFVSKGYLITLQMWGEDMYNIFVTKCDVDLWSSMGCKDSDSAMTAALRFLRKQDKQKPT